MGHQCICCRVVFDSAGDHRIHYQSDWHCYNLKRKVAKLPPLTHAEFTERKEVADKEKEAVKNKGKRNKGKKEKKGAKKVIILENGEEIEEEQEPERKWKSGDNPRYRWFCERSAEIELEEMDEEGDEEWEDCSDSEIDEEEEMIVDGDGAGDEAIKCILDGINQRDIALTECMFCGLKSTSCEETVQHMESEHSFFIPSKENVTDLSALITYLNRKVGVGNICLTCNEDGKAFYSLNAVRDHMIKQGHLRLTMTGQKALEYSDFYDFDEDSDDEEDYEIEEGNTGEMVLSNGSVLGHRSLWKYYKQSFDPRMALVPSKRANQINRYRAIGWLDTKADEIQQLRDFKRVAKWKKKNNLRIGLRNNMNDNMKHFKRRDGFCM